MYKPFKQSRPGSHAQPSEGLKILQSALLCLSKDLEMTKDDWQVQSYVAIKEKKLPLHVTMFRCFSVLSIG